MTVKKYQELIAWQKGIALVTEVYEITRDFPRNEIYGLTSQLRQAAVSIPSNIAEGQGRASTGEFIQFLCHARGSLYEIETQIVVARNLKCLPEHQSQKLMEMAAELGRILNGLIKSMQTRKTGAATGHRPLATGY